MKTLREPRKLHNRIIIKSIARKSLDVLDPARNALTCHTLVFKCLTTDLRDEDVKLCRSLEKLDLGAFNCDRLSHVNPNML